VERAEVVARGRRYLEMFDLDHFADRLAGKLSGGMKQKLALACTLVHEPRILILDEPTTGVDPVSRREFWKLLAEFLAQNLTIIMATPYLDEAERCSRVALLNHGTLMALDEPARLQAASGGLILEVVVREPRRVLQALRERLGDQRVQLFGDRLHVRVDDQDASAHLTTLLQEAGLEVTSVRAIVPTLEDVFIELLARKTT
jgi:ABC-2 type transport system ATP-binding protein